MTEFISELFSNIFGNNVVLATIIVSMVPIMELKGGIPFGMSEAFWGANALTRWQAFIFAYIGCFIVTILLYFLFVPIMKFLKKTKIFKGLAEYIDNRVKKQSKQIDGSNQESLTQTQIENENKNVSKKRFFKVLGVLIFVAIPLPLTGVWMGTCIAVMLDLNFWETLVAVGVGNLIAGLIISTICVIFPQFTHILIYIFLVLVLIVVIIEIIRAILNKKSVKNK